MTNTQKDLYILYLEDKIRKLLKSDYVKVNNRKMTKKRALMEQLHEANTKYNELYTEKLELEKLVKRQQEIIDIYKAEVK